MLGLLTTSLPSQYAPASRFYHQLTPQILAVSRPQLLTAHSLADYSDTGESSAARSTAMRADILSKEVSTPSYGDRGGAELQWPG